MPKAEMPKGGEYLGLHRFGKRVVFEYAIGNTKIMDEPWAGKNAFYRRIDLQNSAEKISIPCRVLDAALKVKIIESKGIQKAGWQKGEIVVNKATANAYFIMRISKEQKPDDEKVVLAHLNAERKKEKRWKEVLKAPGKLGKLNS